MRNTFTTHPSNLEEWPTTEYLAVPTPAGWEDVGLWPPRAGEAFLATYAGLPGHEAWQAVVVASVDFRPQDVRRVLRKRPLKIFNPKRLEGFYWIRVIWRWWDEPDTKGNPSEWVVAQWADGYWFVPGTDDFMPNPQIREIDEQRLLRWPATGAA